MLYAVRVVFDIPYSGEFEIGSTTGWFLGCIFMFVYINYGRLWIENKKEKVKDESVGVHLDNKEAIKSKAIHLGFKMDGAPLENHTLLDTMNTTNERCVVQLLPTGAYQFQLINTGSANLCDNEWHQLIVHYSPSIVSIDGNLDSVAIMNNNKDVDPKWSNIYTFHHTEVQP